MIAIDEVPDSVGATFAPVHLDTDDIAYLQYTSGSTRSPVGVEITHRAIGTNVLQMVISTGIDWDIRSVSWLPLYHDMGLLMIVCVAVFGTQVTLMSPVSFVRRPQRWIRQLAAESKHGPTFAAAPNFAFELAVERGRPDDGEDLDLTNVVSLINGSEPVRIASIEKFNAAFAPYGLPSTAIKPSYGMAEATLFVSTIDLSAAATVVYLDREQLGAGRAVQVPRDAPNAISQVSCGRIARSQWGVIVDTETEAEAPRRGGRRDLVARQQHRPRLLGPPRGNRAGVRQQAATPTAGRQPCRRGPERRHLAADRRSRRLPRR